MTSLPIFRLNDQALPANIRPLSAKAREQAAFLQDGKDQVIVRAQGKEYLIEGESLNLSALKQGPIPKATLAIEGVEYPATVVFVDNEAQGVSEYFQQAFEAAPVGWGKPSQIAGTLDELADLQGNRDGLWKNETEKSGSAGGFFSQNPLALKAREGLAAKGNLEEQVHRLAQFRLQAESKWGQAVTQLDMTSLKDGELFAVQKSLALTRMERTPAEVTEGFLPASGKVNGQTIADRELFWQRFKPVGEPSGKMVVLFPGFLQTGRNFYEQIERLNREGHDVMVMDQQWAGQTKGGKEGGVDRGYGITRDVAAMAAFAQETLNQEYAQDPERELILMGTSLGGGPGVIAALTLNQNHLLELKGPAMPQGLRAILQGPFLSPTETLNNQLFTQASKLPLANQIPLPATGLPVLTTDPLAAQKIAQGAVMEDLQARLQAMSAVTPDMDAVLKLVAEGKGPKSEIRVIHSQGDPLASAEKAKWLVETLPHAELLLLDRNDHVLEQQAEEQVYAIQSLNQLIQKQDK